MRSRRFLLALLMGLSLVVLVPSTSYACSCAVASPAQYAEQADLVVRGTFEHLDDGPERAVVGSGDDVVYEVAVAEVYKGRSASTIEVHSARFGASCGLEVPVGTGDEFLVFASGHDGRYAANLCNGTGPATDDLTAELVAHTGPGHPPATPPPATPPPATDPPGTQPPATDPSTEQPPATRSDDAVAPLAAPDDGGADGTATPVVLAAGLGGAGALAVVTWFAWRRRRS